MYRTAAAAGELLDALGFPWWMSHGTLYGSWCFHGILPWDDYIDFGFPRAHVSALEEAVKFTEWRFYRHNPFMAKIWKPREAAHATRHPWTWPFVDLALYDLFPGSRQVLVEYGLGTKYALFGVDEMLPTARYRYGDLSLPVPRMPEVFLDRIYPPWRTEARSADWCHRTEGWYAEPPVWASNRDVADSYPDRPMYHVDLNAPRVRDQGDGRPPCPAP